MQFGFAGLGAKSRASAELPQVPKLPRCFQGRRLVEHGGEWFVYPNEEPPPQGNGEGEILRSAGFHGFVEPRLQWQSSIPLKSGKPRKPARIVPIRERREGKPVPKRTQMAEARQPSKKGGTPRGKPIVFKGRVYPRPFVPSGGRYVADKGKPVRLLKGGPVSWRSDATNELAYLNPLNDDQLRAIRFELWLLKTFDTPLERFLYLVREHNALVVVSDSGGKDSQAMYLYLTRILKVPRKQIRVIHADMPGADWPGTLDHIKATVDERVNVVVAKWGETGAVKELYDYVLHRGKFPSAAQRYCTSDLKRAPIDAWTRKTLCELARKKVPCKIPPGGQRVVISCMGMRAQESDTRAGLNPWELSVGDSIAGRLWFDYLPIFDWQTAKVFKTIKDCGQKPFWIYGKTPEDCRRLIARGSVDKHGHCVPMERMSCVFCILASVRDMGVASLAGPAELAERLCNVEKETGHTFKHGSTLGELIEKGRAEVRAGKKKSLPVVRTARARRGPCP